MLPVSEHHAAPAQLLTGRRLDACVRAECDLSDATLGARVRRSHQRRVPYVAVLGEHELSVGTVALRLRDGRQLRGVAVDDAIAEITMQVSERRCDLGFG